MSIATSRRSGYRFVLRYALVTVLHAHSSTHTSVHLASPMLNARNGARIANLPRQNLFPINRKSFTSVKRAEVD